MRRHLLRILVVTLGAGLGPVGCDALSPSGSSNDPPPGPVLPLVVPSQTLEDLSTVVTVASIATPGPAWIAVGTPADATSHFLGWIHVEAGATTDVALALERPVTDGEMLVAYLLDDSMATGSFDGAAVDAIVVTEEGDEVVVPFVVTVPAGTPAVRFHLDYERMTGSWSFGAVEPARFTSWVEPFVDNPGLTLVQGWRYSFVNAVSTDDPLELIEMQSSNTTDDVVLLSQSALGADETVAAVLWDETATDEVRLTLAAPLAAVLNGYRSAARPSMRGLIYVVASAP